MSQLNLFTSGEFQYTPTNNLTTLQSVNVSQSDCLQSLVLDLRDEFKSLKSEILEMKKEIKDLKDDNKRSLTKLTEEVIAVKLENRKHNNDTITIDENKEVQKLPLAIMDDLEKFDVDVQANDDKLRQFKVFIAKTGGEGPAQFLRAAVRKVFSSLYSWKGTSTKPSAEKCFLITIIKNICHLKFKCTNKEMNAVLQKHFVHAKDRVSKRKRPN